jgi:hypothetical protein
LRKPAAVCILPSGKGDTWLQAVAEEFSRPDTSFLVEQPDESLNGRLAPGLAIIRGLYGHDAPAFEPFVVGSGDVSVARVEDAVKSAVLQAANVGEDSITTRRLNRANELVLGRGSGYLQQSN